MTRLNCLEQHEEVKRCGRPHGLNENLTWHSSFERINFPRKLSQILNHIEDYSRHMGLEISGEYLCFPGRFSSRRICNQRVLSKLPQELSRISSGMFVQPQTFRRFGQHFAFWPKQTDWYHLRERNRLIFHFHYNNQKF